MRPQPPHRPRDLAEFRRKNPTDDLTSALVNAEVGEEMLAPEEIGPFFILLAVAGNDTTRTATSHGMHLLSQFPDQRRTWQDDLAGTTATAVDEIVRMASPVTFMRRTVTRDLTLSEGTVKVHVSAILKALRVRSRTEAIAMLARRGISADTLAARRINRGHDAR